MMNATEQQALAVTSVFWDIKTFPVPPDSDARLVGPCIKRFLENLGYSGPLTIIAVGLLTDVPRDVLRALSSTGIVLNHVVLGSIGILGTIDDWIDSYPPPANMMLISSIPSIFSKLRQFSEYNIFQLFPYDSPNAESLWKDFLLGGAPKEDKCSGTGESAYWLCSLCYDSLCQGFENFTTHLSSQEHEQEATQMAEDTVAVTSVFWDIKRCPVPPDCDARRVAPCIKQYLEDLGYSGPLTINAIGQLTDVPYNVLRAVSSTGIILNYDSRDIMHFMDLWSYLNPPPANILVICPYSKAFAKVDGDLRRGGYNIIELFPCGSPYSEPLWRSFLLQDSGTLEEDKCSESGEHASWVCSVCDITGKGFENFTTHLFRQEHKQKVTQVAEEAVAVAVTSVLWDIKRCPVPPDCDARWVAPCIKKYLEDLCFSGPLTINAIIDKLTDVPDDVLRAVSSTGIVLNHYAFDSGNILLFMYLWVNMNPPPANIWVICPYSEAFAKVVGDLRRWGYNIIEPFPADSPYSESRWRSFLRQDSGTREEDKCSESGEHASWVCQVCHDIDGKGFENFITHVSQKHGQKMSVYLSDEKHEEAVEAGVEASLDSHTKRKKKQRKRKHKKILTTNERRRHWR